MPNGNVASLGALSPSKENTVPIIGQKVLLNWAKYGYMCEVPDGSPMSPKGTYIEVEVKAVKTAKVILE